MSMSETDRGVVGARFAETLVVTGMARESACLKGDGLRIVCSGANSARLRAALDDFSGAEVACVVSFGLAGGLAESLRPGDAVIAAGAIYEGQRLDADSKLAHVLREGLLGAGISTVSGLVAGVDAPVMTPAAKAELRAKTSAHVVDMESHIAAQFAAARGLPFAAVRIVSDPATRALPKLAASAITPDGGVNLPLILKELAREPGQLGEMLMAGRDARAAFATLRRCGPLLGPLARLVLAGL